MITGTGVAEQTVATVTVAGADCVCICCPFLNGSGCPAATADQCK